MPGCVRIASAAAVTSRSRSRPACGRTCMVISLATSDCHSAAEALTSSTVPVVMEARNVMMATTATSARPEIDARGTIGDMLRARAGTCGRSVPRSTSGPCSSSILLIDMQPPWCSTIRRASYWSISVMSWVAMMTAVPSLFSSMNSRSRRRPSVGSTLPVGSSASSNCGREITARAIAARCFSPPDRIGGSASMRSPRPTHFRRSITSLR